MKRAIVLAIFALFVICMVATADTAVVTLGTGYNLVAASLVPYDPSPSVVFNQNAVFPGGSAITITGNRLFRYDTAAGTYKYYSTLGGGSAFGKVLLGMGMFLKVDSGTPVWVYAGVPNGVPDSNNKKTDMWISLPAAGYNMIGNPFTTDGGTPVVTWSNCFMTDGNVTVTVAAAKAAPYSWWTGNLQYYNNSAGTYSNIVLTGIGTKTMSPYQGYLLHTLVPNLALIIPSPN